MKCFFRQPDEATERRTRTRWRAARCRPDALKGVAARGTVGRRTALQIEPAELDCGDLPPVFWTAVSWKIPV